MRFSILSFFFFYIVSFLSAVHGYNNGLGKLPIMGWNTWCTKDACGLLDYCTEKEILSVADAMIAQNMTALGYEYINLDDCWEAKEREQDGQLKANPRRFPHGIRWLADQIHAKGLKLGIYICAGTKTCKYNRPGSWGYFDIDSKTLVDEWDVDLVKMDWCSHPDLPPKDVYSNMSYYLNQTSKPVIFSTCEWGNQNVWEWGYNIAQQWRVHIDHLPLWSFPKKNGQGLKELIEVMAGLAKYAQPYGYNDPDFLETLFPVTMNYEESKTEASFWSLWASPWIVATEIRNMNDEKKSILMNQDIISINQDELVYAGERIVNDNDTAINADANNGQLWARPLSNGDLAFIFYNPNDKTDITMKVNWSIFNRYYDITGHTNLFKIYNDDEELELYDLWEHKTIGTFGSEGYSDIVKPHGVSYIQVKRSKN